MFPLPADTSHSQTVPPTCRWRFTCHETGPGTATSLLFSRTSAAQIGWRWRRAQAKRRFPASWANASRLSAGVLENLLLLPAPFPPAKPSRRAQQCRIRALPSLLPSTSSIGAACALGGCWKAAGTDAGSARRAAPLGNAACLCGAALPGQHAPHTAHHWHLDSKVLVHHPNSSKPSAALQNYQFCLFFGLSRCSQPLPCACAAILPLQGSTRRRGRRQSATGLVAVLAGPPTACKKQERTAGDDGQAGIKTQPSPSQSALPQPAGSGLSSC